MCPNTQYAKHVCDLIKKVLTSWCSSLSSVIVYNVHCTLFNVNTNCYKHKHSLTVKKRENAYWMYVLCSWSDRTEWIQFTEANIQKIPFRKVIGKSGPVGSLDWTVLDKNNENTFDSSRPAESSDKGLESEIVFHLPDLHDGTSFHLPSGDSNIIFIHSPYRSWTGKFRPVLALAGRCMMMTICIVRCL